MVNVLLIVKEEKLAIFFSFYSQTVKVNLIAFRQKVSVKGFNGKQCKKKIKKNMAFIMKVFYSLHRRRSSMRVENELSPIPLGKALTSSFIVPL